jgi:hypothetical protein
VGSLTSHNTIGLHPVRGIALLLYEAVSQMAVVFIATAVITSNPTSNLPTSALKSPITEG